MKQTNLKNSLAEALANFSQSATADSFKHLFETLGYSTQREVMLDTHTPDEVVEVFGWENFREDRGLLSEWESVDCLFQVTEDEISQNSQLGLFQPSFDKDYLKSYAFIGLTLHQDSYSRSQLASITREINRQSDIPIMVLFRYGDYVTLSVINRRPNKLDRDKDVLEKIILIKDINIHSPHRAHIEILTDLALFSLRNVRNFDELHDAWRKVLDTSELNKKFFQEVSNWYFWAISNSRTGFQPVKENDNNNRQDACSTATFIIRLITRLIFVWFLKEKGLVPEALFDESQLRNLLKSLESESSTYYKGILQNLFFATLNTEMNTAKKLDNRKFRIKGKKKGQRDQNFMVHNVYRYQDYFTNSDRFLELCSNIPFLNGGLFECLDKNEGTKERPKYIRIDGFSDRQDNPLVVPNMLFFGEEKEIDLNNVYGTKKRKYKVQGIIDIFNRYKFTIDENTPIEEEIALDPELLGKVFENLLAEYNPETETTARKQTGSFYTPREIVNYMVDESLIAYLVEQASSLLEHKQDACTTDIFFSEDIDIETTQQNLPHWRQKAVTYFVTFRLADSISQEKLNLLKQEREDWLKSHKKPLSKVQTEEYYRLFSQRVEDWLDAGVGECYLKDSKIAQIVADALRHFDGDRYHLGEWVIMPNHVHVLVTPLSEHKLSDILHSWKSFTAKQINQAFNRRGKVWQEEYYNRIIRSPQHLYLVEQYIHNNPKKAGISIVEQASSLLNKFHKQDACATRLRHLLSYNDEPHQFNDREVERLINAIDNVKIIDIACGSGAFPMGILQKLVFILGKLDPNNSRWKQQQKEKAIQPVLKDIQVAKQISYEEAREEAIQKLQERLAEIEREFETNEMDYPRKLFLIENCIFGVDIQPIAVQIAKLRFFISLIVDQKVNENQPNRGILPLPNLETKFVAANSLIGIETQFSLRSPAVMEKEGELKKVREQYFTARTPRTKQKCRERDEVLRQEISELLKVTGLESATADTLARWNPYDLNMSSDFFDAEWMFGVSDGFDICIGNPPYVRQEKIKELKPTLKQQYDCYTGVADLYVYFFEQGINLLRKKGVLCYISSNKYFRSGYGKKLREFLDKKTQLQQLIDFGDAPVFTAIAYPSIIITGKSEVEQASSLLNKSHKQDACATVRVLNWEMSKPIDDFISIFNKESFEIEQKALKSDGWRLEDNTVLQLLEKLRKAGTPLGEYVNGRFYYGIKTGFNEAFIVDRETRDRLIAEHPSSEEVLKSLVRGRDVKRWVVNNPDLWLLFIPWHFPLHEDNTIVGASIKAEEAFKKQYPAVYNHLCQFQEQLSARNKAETGIRYEWYALQRCAASYWQEFEQPKIIYPDIAPSACFAFDTNKIYTEATLFFIPDTTLYLLAILNSRTFNYFFGQVSPKIRGNFLRYKKIYLSQIPIPKPTHTQDACVTEIVIKILEIKRNNPNANTTDLEAEIDQIVYQLYGLTEEEIAIIEESVKRK